MTCQETAKDPNLITRPVLHGAGSVTAAASYTAISLKATPSELLTSTWATQNCTQTPRFKEMIPAWCNGTWSIPLDIILGSWLQVALLEQEGWAR